MCAQLCLTLCDSMNRSPPCSSVCGISQARILEWIATPSSRGSSQSRDRTQVSCIVGGFFTTDATWEPREIKTYLLYTHTHTHTHMHACTHTHTHTHTHHNPSGWAVSSPTSLCGGCFLPSVCRCKEVSFFSLVREKHWPILFLKAF